jgi:hypothetical protein
VTLPQSANAAEDRAISTAVADAVDLSDSIFFSQFLLITELIKNNSAKNASFLLTG